MQWCDAAVDGREEQRVWEAFRTNFGIEASDRFPDDAIRESHQSRSSSSV
jgi:hypothetical protein